MPIRTELETPTMSLEDLVAWVDERLIEDDPSGSQLVAELAPDAAVVEAA